MVKFTDWAANTTLEAGSIWVDPELVGEMGVPFGGFKQSGLCEKFGQYDHDASTQVKAVHINIDCFASPLPQSISEEGKDDVANITPSRKRTIQQWRLKHVATR
ncbi:hypothetical protein AGABI1DRAFT_89908 [Agaricus bisporus var. burnettii JB137-S8]|uniref:Aldehyde dehydrogenase domain-containing protein n=1 Tax=Agaricus bisporus var. burnettii (strain JB137-S8 / ATCC MYA-4627 / FGSC 10392) TaxID=597362 RepID=K5Y0W6_AGABU|nr:uncharacterized protein AGABI1DRAFT_89908 [Agaricus bisporus var. burnettii JB137-S8]EKM81430.1 hypothetical protein AGABI1DRAFT_89908 [Agaricus bisporus var. burnettii JB137-S8]